MTAKHTLTDTEIWAIANSLRCAADEYKKTASDASLAHTFRRGFNDQATVALTMAARLENAVSLTIEEDGPSNPWVIFYDYLDKKAVNIGPGKHLPLAELPIIFQLLDDDDELYYEGRMKIHQFDPLDNFGMPGAGCTTLRYLEDGEWKVL